MSQASSVVVTPHEVKVLIGDVPHLLVRRSDVVGVQGYIKNVGPVAPIHFVEIVTRSSPIVCEYADRALWEAVLRDLGSARIFDERLGERG